MIKFPEIPAGSILGLNYSGMHDSAIAIVGPDGAPLLALALERISRVKQDGRPPDALLENMPWKRIAKIAVSTDKEFIWPAQAESGLMPVRLPSVRKDGLKHEKPFYDFLDTLPCEKEFVCHQMSHAASAFWGSHFEEALCLTYDGGMCNSPWFGALYKADRKNGIQPLEHFNALQYAKITSLYTFVTALLGFTPNKHEGKITGLAAYGKPTERCRALMRQWLEQEYFEIESALQWVFAYDQVNVPALLTNDARMQPFRDAAKAFSKEELAATVQELAERHIVEILDRARSLGWKSDNICLAGGLFANVKINQRVVEWGFKNLFVAPPMTDDGTALGAAWHVLSKQKSFNPKPLHSMYLGPTYSKVDVATMLSGEGIQFSSPENPTQKVAELLAGGSTVAVFQGAMEFGPRALGNRTILAQATDAGINRRLNDKLNRTEFMPFAPVTRMENAEECYEGIKAVAHAAEFMTVTVNCTKFMKKSCPAVVHVDGTARPQLVSKDINPFLHAVLTSYTALTSLPALVNTSFNIHEEPIVCSPQDAVRGFFESGLDYLCLDGGIIVSFNENKDYALALVQKKLREPSPKIKTLAVVADMYAKRVVLQDSELEAKEKVIQQLSKHAGSHGDELQARQKVIDEQKQRLDLLDPELAARQKKIDEQKKRLDSQESELQALQKVIAEQAARLGLQDSELAARQKIIDEQKKRLDGHESELQARQKVIAEQAARLELQDSELKVREKVIGAQAQCLDAQAEELITKEKVMEDQANRLKAKAQAIAEQAARLELQDSELKVREKVIGAQAQRLDAQAEELITKEKVMEDQANRLKAKAQALEAKEQVISDLVRDKNNHDQDLQSRDRVITYLTEQMDVKNRELDEKDKVIQDLKPYKTHAQFEQEQRVVIEKAYAAIEHNSKVMADAIEALSLCQQSLEIKEKVIKEQSRALFAYKLASLPVIFKRVLEKGVYSKFKPRLGNLNQYPPRPLAPPPLQISDRALERYPLISIVTPSFNQGLFIGKTLDSVLDQKYPALEFFVQDGGSRDSTVEVLQQYEGKLAGWVSEKDSGQSQAINRGLAKTSGEIMAWLNSDDLLMPGALHTVADFFNRNPDVDVVYGDRLLVDKDGMEIGRWIMPGHDDDILTWVDYVPQETMFWRRRIWDKAGGRIDESFRFAMDWDLLVRFRDAGAKFAHIPQFLGAFRIHEQQKTSAAISQIGYQEMDRIRERILGRVPERHEIHKAMRSYMVKHVAADLRYRIKKQLGVA